MNDLPGPGSWTRMFISHFRIIAAVGADPPVHRPPLTVKLVSYNSGKFGAIYLIFVALPKCPGGHDSYNLQVRATPPERPFYVVQYVAIGSGKAPHGE